MIAAWLVYAIVVGLLTGGAALVLDRLLRPHRAPVRWLWLGGMLFSVLVPVSALFLGRLGDLLLRVLPLGNAGTVTRTIVLAEPLVVGAEGASTVAWLDPLLAGLWAAASFTLLVWWAVASRRIRVLTREGRPHRIGSEEVVLTRNAGPAVVGIFDGRILLPGWLAHGDRRRLEIVLLHEREHAKARDTGLLSASFLLCAALPWNLALWWMWRRLREGVEIDCDRRVLQQRPELLRPYAETLLLVGARSTNLAVTGAAALTEPSSLLERRIKSMTSERPNHPVIRGLILGLVAFLVLAGACTVPEPGERSEGPTGPEEASEEATIRSQIPPPDVDLSREEGEEPFPGRSVGEEPSSGRSVSEGVSDAGRLRDAPTFTPYTVRPELGNRTEVQGALTSEYPPLLRDAGIGGTVTVWFLIDADGRLEATRIRESSGQRALDEAALRVARAMEFTPALDDGQPVPVWISLPITFRPGL